MEQPTYDDVNLILRLYELRREEKMRQARDWFAKSCKPKTFEEFQQLCPPGSEQNAYYRMVMSYWDMVASFITSKVLNEELFFQSGGELMFCWARTMHLIPEMRKLFGPRVGQNMEEVANRYIRYMEERDPGWFERLTTMVRA